MGDCNYDKSVTEKGLKNYSREQRAHIAVAESLSKVFSNKITVYDSENVSGDMQWAKTKNGSFRSQDGTIWVDINAQQGVLGALSHELTHMVSLLDERTFKKISEILIDEYADITKAKSVEDYIREYEERLNLGTKAAYEEFVADCMTNMLTDTNAPETIVKLRNTMNEKAQNKFIKLINDTIRTLKSFVKRSNAIEAASITSQLKSLQKISDLWAQGVSNAMTEFEKTENKGKTVETDKYSVKYTDKNNPVVVVNDDISRGVLNDKELVKAVKNSLSKFKYVPIDKQKIYFTTDTKKETTYSQYTKWLRNNKADVYQDKMCLLNHPVDVILATTNYVNEGLKHPRKDNIVDFARGNLLLDILGNKYEANVVIGFTKYGMCELYDIVNMKPTTFEYKKEASYKDSSSKKGLSQKGNASFNNIISTNTEKSQEKFSKKLTNVVDSDGKKLSEAQAEFFKDSKVRDEDGNLLKVYHGTNSDFTVFNRGEKNGWLGKGIYFAADKSYAKENGKKVVSAYLNVENPFTVTDNTNILTAINEKFPGTDYIEMTKVLADNGYDGIIYDHWDRGKIIVAFEPNQIKLTDNLTPTENEDVRFSDKTGFIKNGSQADRVVESLDKYLSKKYDDSFELDGNKVEFISIEQSHGMGSYATFYIEFSINETDGITIRYSGHTNSTADYYLWNDDFSSVNEIKKAIDDIVTQEITVEMPKRKKAIADVMANFNKSNVQYSTKQSFKEQVDNVLNNTYDKNNHVYMGMTPKVLTDVLGISKLPMLITNNHVYTMSVSKQKAQADNRYNPNSNYHDLGAETVKKIPSMLEKPFMLIKSNTDSKNIDFVVITNEVDKNGSPIMVAVKPYGKGNYFNTEILSNVNLSAYGKYNYKNYINTARNEGRILYINKSNQPQNTTGVQFPNNILNADYSNSISNYRKNVNEFMKKFSNVDTINTNPMAFSEKLPAASYEKVIKSLEKDNAALREDVNDLKELVKVQGKVTHGEVFTKTSVEAVAKKLARDFGMRGEKTELVKMLNEYYSSIASSASDSNLNFTDVMENTLPIAQYINENIPEINVLDDQAQEILDYLKTSKISFSPLKTVLCLCVTNGTIVINPLLTNAEAAVCGF